MANSEGIGQLLANSALMKGERELLRRQDEPQAEASKPAAQQTAEPIVHDSKAVAAVLLTLLDERLQAADSALAARPRNAASTDAEREASKRVAAQYAADGLIAGDDFAPPGMSAPSDQVRMREMPPVASPDLQSYLQRFAAVALGRSAAVSTIDIRAGNGTRQQGPSVFGSAPFLRLAGIAAGVLWLGLLVAQWMAR